MPDTPQLSEAKRALLEQYLRGNLPQTKTNATTILRRSRGCMAPLAFGQQQLWLLGQLIGDVPVYTECVTIHLPGQLDIAALEQSFNEVIRRHEAWRTSFPIVDEQPVQLIHPAATFTLSVVDLRHLPEDERVMEAHRLATKEVQRPFDLSHGPLQRAVLMRLSEVDHRLFLTLHHIIFDGFSLYQILLPELRALYEAFLNAKPSPLPELPIQYADFAIWQREYLQGSMLASQLAYWKKQLEGAPATLALPTDHPRPQIQSFRGLMHPFTLSRNLTEALKALSQREGVTLYITMAAAFLTLLHRYTQQDDILIGTALSDRKRPEVQGLMGYFLNTLVLRNDLSGNPTFPKLLQRVREVLLEAHAHSDVPFEYLVKELQPERNLSQNPLIQVMLSIEPPLAILPSGWTLTQMDIETDTSKFDLSLELDDRPEGMIGRFEYSTDLFDTSTIARMAGHWMTLLEGIVAKPEQRLSELPLLTETERHQLLIEWNAAAEVYPKDRCTHQLFEEQVERTPETVAVVLENKSLTYHELNSKANQLAHYLQRLGVGPEVLVGIYVERSLEMIVGLLAILKAGGAYVPLDPAYPQERLAFMLQDSRVAVLLTQQELVERLPEHHTQIVCLDTGWEVIAQEPAMNPLSRVTADNLAYVIYTSGSTGKPKGVLITHGSIANHCRTIKRAYGLTSNDRVLQFSTSTFDTSLEQILPTLLVGARVVLRGRDIWSPTELHEKILGSGLTVINLPTAYWHQLAQAWANTPELIPNHHLRLVIVGGEQMLPQCLNLWLQLPLSSVRLLNAYGPTETTITATIFEIPPLSDKNTPWEKIPIGRPLSNRTAYILDTHGHPVPIGVPGELHLGGDLLARGYLNRPELTVERFIPHPFSDEPAARLYRTGDLARYRQDGAIEFLGRIDHQVKLRGFRIELGEIEVVLRQHPDVREAGVAVREDTPGNKYLVAYLVVAQQETSPVHSIQSFLKEKLPAYMLPSIFVMLDVLPLSPSGKIDRAALPAPDTSTRTVEENFVAPTTTAHYQLIKIWEELLDTGSIGIRDNFFLLGGHSLLAAQLVARIQEVFGKKISLATLFAGPTIEQLANALKQHEEIAPPPAITAVQTGESRRPFFFLHGAHKAGAFYCFPLAHAVGIDQPFYAIDPYKFHNLTTLPTLEAIAATHVEQMRGIQPEGPYLLGGFCNGGLFAYEMARQLYAQGQAVDLLVLMEPTPVASYQWLRRAINFIGNLLHCDQDTQIYWFLWPQHLYKYLLHLYRYLCYPHYRPLEEELKHEQVNTEGTIVGTLKALYEQKVSLGIARLRTDEQMGSGHKRGKARFTLPRLHSFFPDALFPPAKVLRRDWGGLFHWIASVYAPGSYAGKSTFFVFQDSKEWYRYRKPWHKLATTKGKEVETYILPGTHNTSKTMYLAKLADCLRECLDKAQKTQLD